MPVRDNSAKTDSYITFLMNHECYAINVANITELLEMMPITKVPRMPDFVRGIINLRSEVIPVVDCRMRFGLPPVEDTVDTCIIIMSVEIDEEIFRVGLVVDSVSEVIDCPEADIQPLPHLGKYRHVSSITGIIKPDSDSQMVMVMDVDKEFQRDIIELTEITAGPGALS